MSVEYSHWSTLQWYSAPKERWMGQKRCANASRRRCSRSISSLSAICCACAQSAMWVKALSSSAKSIFSLRNLAASQLWPLKQICRRQGSQVGMRT
jgi:hypothetical protein